MQSCVEPAKQVYCLLSYNKKQSWKRDMKRTRSDAHFDDVGSRQNELLHHLSRHHVSSLLGPERWELWEFFLFIFFKLSNRWFLFYAWESIGLALLP